MASSESIGTPSGSGLSDRQFGNQAAGDVKDRVSDMASDAKNRISDAASQAKDKAAELGRSTADAVDRNVHAAAGKLESAASTLRQTGSTGGSKLGDVASKAAQGLDTTARYFREYNTRDMVGSAEQLIRRNPGASIVAAVAVGFLIGSALKNND